MEENYISPILYEIFPHLKPTKRADEKEYVRKNDKKSRECVFYILDKLIVNVGLKWVFQNGNIKEQYNVTPFVRIRFNNLRHKINARNERPCSNKQFNFFVVNLKSNFDIPALKKSNFQFKFNFPLKDSPDVTILSFINEREASKYSSNFLYFEEEDSNQALHFLSQLQNFITQRNLYSCILIIFCRETCYQNFLRLIRIISPWFRFYGIIIWIAVVDEVTICRFNFGNHFCKIDTEYLFMFINNPSYEARSTDLLLDCDNPDKIRKQLTEFRQEVGSSSGSIAFMHVSYGRMKKFYCLDTSLFREVFPEVLLFPFYGKVSINTLCFLFIHDVFMPPEMEPLLTSTTILLISRR